MQSKKNQLPKEKAQLHSRNKHQGRYDFAKLIDTSPELAQFVKPNKFGNESINFFDPDAVKMLNLALLKHHYNIKYWDIPKHYLCPPIPGRADYIHNVADLLGSSNKGVIPKGKNITCLDIGVGANCIYPIIGNSEYDWSFVGSDVDEVAIASATKIVEQNPDLKDAIELRLQKNPRHLFDGVIRPNEKFDVTICNPPFHSSLEEAEASAAHKIKNLTKQKTIKPVLNFGGKPNELWCKGGEAKFVKDMIFESRRFKRSCFWFTTLVSKESNLRPIYNVLKKVEAKEVKTLSMGQGNKISRVVAWTFLDKTQQDTWILSKK